MKKIVIAGGTGNLGQLLIDHFLEQQGEVYVLSRQAKISHREGLHYVQWDGETLFDWVYCLEEADVLINLSGKSIQCRFTEKNKELLLSSRIAPTRILGDAIAKLQQPPRLWINFSGISVFEGIEHPNDEESSTFATTFLATLTKRWEQSFFDAKGSASTQQVCLRISPVLSNKFGMFKELQPLAKWGLGGHVGDGQQYISWIHETDLVRLVQWIMDLESPSNLYHACVPQPVSNRVFMQDLRSVVGTPFGLPLPTPLAKIGALLKGVESDLLLLTNHVLTSRTINQGFEFSYPDTITAFKHLTKN